MVLSVVQRGRVPSGATPLSPMPGGEVTDSETHTSLASCAADFPPVLWTRAWTLFTCFTQGRSPLSFATSGLPSSWNS